MVLKIAYLRSLLLLAGSSAVAFAGNFAAPAEGPVAFRRDRVPLDAESMAKLSSQLTILAAELDDDTPLTRRGAAQMLALALGLDPANKKARDLIGQFENGSHRPETDHKKASSSRARIWGAMDWLESSEAGDDGQELAKCLQDVLAVSDPQDSRSKEWLAHGEQGAWEGWIPELVLFKDPSERGNADPSTAVDKPDPGITPASILLEHASVMVPLWIPNDPSEPTQWTQDLAPLQMTAGKNDDEDRADDPFSIRISSATENNQFDGLYPVLLQNLRRQHGELPDGCWVMIDSPDFAKSIASNKRQTVSAAAAVLASAAISGRAPNAGIIGTLDANGTFKLPSRFWQQLASIRSRKGSRLVLPTEAAEYLPSILALENPQFFFDHEILLASNFSQLLEFSSEKPDEALANASVQFQQIREKAQSQPLGQYLANSFVRRRLAELSQAAPYHYSAKMLALQGSGNRPTFVKRDVLSLELLRAIEPMDWLITRSYEELTTSEVSQIGPTFEKCRTEVERLNRYSTTTDRVLVERVSEAVNLLRGMERAAKTRPDAFWEEGMNSAQREALSALQKSHAAAKALLNIPLN